ncbi:MAG: glycosyltransferase family 2 protein [Leptolyngbyaceae bacterium]|nr:glycosyltransferase family 2 protein [Leptolyngbyaceae bacterium]
MGSQAPPFHHSPKNCSLIQRYLAQYAEPQVDAVATLQERLRSRQTNLGTETAYAAVLVIPAFDESIGFMEQVLPTAIANTLVIVVVNAAEDSDRPALNRTQQLLHSFNPGDELLTVIPHNATTDLIVVDCCTPGRQLPPKQGVGLARKIGGDIALACIMQELVASLWIHYTDADVVLPQDFFQVGALGNATIAQPHDDIAVILYPFRHHPWHGAIALYEASLRYYVVQLAWARSPYAFHTIGSLMCVNAVHYAKVRGFPKRKAAEDFYMLNKLAKTGTVVQLQHPIVILDSRISHRVPFGTGATMTRLAQAPTLTFYHPQIFVHLRDWLQCLDQLWSVEGAAMAQSPSDRGMTHLEQWFATSPWSGAPWLPHVLDIGLAQTLQQAQRQSGDRPHFQRFMHTWFDAFRTLKFVHYLRDQSYPSLSFEQLMEELGRSPFWADMDAMNQDNRSVSASFTVDDFQRYLIDQETRQTLILEVPPSDQP